MAIATRAPSVPIAESRRDAGPTTQPPSSRRLRWSIGLIALGVVVAVIRWQMRSQYLFDLDSILYARALNVFDLQLHQPPLPGYWVYIQIGRVAQILFADPNLSLEVVSAVLGLALCLPLYALGRDLYDRQTGIIAAAVGLTGPVFWYQSSVASPRIAEAFFAAVIVWLGVRLRLRPSTVAFWWLVVTVAVAGGIRQQILLYFLPFCLWATWHSSLKRRAAGVLVGGMLVMVWLVPTLLGAGGLDQYRVLSSQQWTDFIVNQTGVMYGSSLTDSLHRLLENCGRIGLYLAFTSPLGLLLATLFILSRSYRAPRLSFPAQGLLVSTLPALLFFAIVHIQQIGHILAIAPLFAIVVARAIALSWRPHALALACVAVNLAFVLLSPAKLFGDRVTTPSLATVVERDRFITAALTGLRAGDPSETVAIASPLGYGFIEQYAPEYTYVLIPDAFDPPGASTRQAHDILTNGLRVVAPVPGRDRTVLMPSQARRFVTVGYESDISRILITDTLQRPDPDMPGVAVALTQGPTAIQFAPSHLQLMPTQSVVGTHP